MRQQAVFVVVVLWLSARGLADEPPPRRDNTIRCCSAGVCEAVDSVKTCKERLLTRSVGPTTNRKAVERVRLPSEIDIEQIFLPDYHSKNVKKLRVDECVDISTTRADAKASGMPATTRFQYCSVIDLCRPASASQYLAWKLPELGGQGTHVQRPPTPGQVYWSYIPEGKRIFDVEIVTLAQLAAEDEECPR